MTIDLKQLKAPFPQDRVSWRAQTVTKAGDKALALAYIDARDVMERLDEVCGPENWQKRYSHADKKTVCEIGIKIDGEWVWKADGAGDSDIEAEKGALSDAFKRAAVSWGIGRYLYDLETPWVPCESYEKGGKMHFSKFTADPWKHVRNKPAAVSEVPKEANGEADRADAWIAKAKAKITEMSDRERIMQWTQGDFYKDAINALQKNHPDKAKAFIKWFDDYRNTLPPAKEAA